MPSELLLRPWQLPGANTKGQHHIPFPAPTFAPFHLRQGQITIYIGGMEGEFPVYIDDLDVGVASKNRPLTLMTDEGTRSVEVCCGITCERENVTIRFGKPRTIDFSEQLERDCEFSEPAVRIIDYFLSGDQLYGYGRIDKSHDPDNYPVSRNQVLVFLYRKQQQQGRTFCRGPCSFDTESW